MTNRALFFTYLFFFFMYFFGFELMGAINSGFQYPWHKRFEALDFSYYTYTLLTVLLAHFVVFRRYYHARPRWKLFAAILALLVFFILFRYLLEEILYPAILGFGNYNPKTTFRYYIFDNVYFGSIKIFIGFVLYLFDEMFRNLKKQAHLKEQTRRAELNFLQAQMNPHFLFNSLNNIYSLALEQHPQTASSVHKLSEMMRYVTYRDKKETTLANELEYIESMIAIQQLRHDHKLHVQFNIDANVKASVLPPLLLIPLVENALKHGDLSDESIPLSIKAKKEESKLSVEVRNKKSLYTKTNTGGIGLQNLGRQMELLYQPHEYTFEIKETETVFIVTLKIPCTG